MADKKQQNDIPHENTVKDPDEWTTGDESMTGAQRSYLKTLTKAEASERIDELQHKPAAASTRALASPSLQHEGKLVLQCRIRRASEQFCHAQTARHRFAHELAV